MAFIDELREKATDVAQVAGRKMGDAYSATKIKVAISEKKGNLRTLYKELGEMVYNNFKKDIVDENAVEDKIAEIDLVMEVISELNDEYKKLKNVIVCPSCGETIDAESNFCSKCGMQMDINE